MIFELTRNGTLFPEKKGRNYNANSQEKQWENRVFEIYLNVNIYHRTKELMEFVTPKKFHFYDIQLLKVV